MACGAKMEATAVHTYIHRDNSCGQDGVVQAGVVLLQRGWDQSARAARRLMGVRVHTAPYTYPPRLMLCESLRNLPIR